MKPPANEDDFEFVVPRGKINANDMMRQREQAAVVERIRYRGALSDAVSEAGRHLSGPPRNDQSLNRAVEVLRRALG